MVEALCPRRWAVELLPQLAGVLDEVARLVSPSDGFDPSRLRQSFVIRSGEAVLAILGSRLTELSLAEAPAAKLRFELEGPDDVEDLRAGKVALGIGGYGDLTSDIDVLSLAEEELVGVLRADHRLATARVTPRRFADLQHIVVSRRAVERGPIDEALGALGLRRPIAAIVPSALAAITMVLSSDATAVLPSRLVARLVDATGLHVYPVPVDTQPVQILAVWHHRFTRAPGHRWLRSCVTRAVADHRPVGG